MHEELRDRGLLHYHDRLAELQRSPGHMIFFSHQWTAFGSPDHTGEQYKCMVSSTLRIVAEEGWKLRHTWVWVDYISIPQRCSGMQLLAINSLATYASCADAFAIVAPPVIHAGTGQPLSMDSYNKRMWCRTENLCFSLCQGSGAMWISTSQHECHRLKEEPDFLRSNLYVFEGEATVEKDKLSLVEPILGLHVPRALTQLTSAPPSQAPPPWKGGQGSKLRLTHPPDPLARPTCPNRPLLHPPKVVALLATSFLWCPQVLSLLTMRADPPPPHAAPSRDLNHPTAAQLSNLRHVLRHELVAHPVTHPNATHRAQVCGAVCTDAIRPSERR